MATNFELARGVQAAHLDGIEEGFCVCKTEADHHYFFVNITVRRIADVFLSLARQVDEPGFLIIENR